MKNLRLVLALILLSCLLAAQGTYSSGRHRYWVGTVPTSATSIETGTVYLHHANFSTGGSSGTITIKSRGTDCAGSAACPYGTAIAIAANTEYEIDYGDAIAPGGINILATGTVTANIHWVTQVIP